LFLPICEIKNVEIVILNQSEDTSFAQDALDIITVFSARLYGARSKKNKNLIDGLKAAAAAR
jgi:putative resolvase